MQEKCKKYIPTHKSIIIGVFQLFSKSSSEKQKAIFCEKLVQLPNFLIGLTLIPLCSYVE